MGPFSPPALPPVTAEYTSALQTAGAATAPQQSAYRLFRASDGKTRVDTGNLSVIHDPAAGKTIVLDHVKKTAQIAPSVPQAPQMPGMPQMPQMPGMPAMPGAPQMPAMHVQDLGKSFMQGQQVEGKRYTIAPPAMPQMPGAPSAPQAPQLPGMPKPPQIPGAPKLPAMPAKPAMPSTAEVWTSPQLQLPMASKVNGSFGQQTAVCQKAIPGEPNPAVFQIPPDYKQLLPKPPSFPKAPSVPKLPGM